MFFAWLANRNLQSGAFQGKRQPGVEAYNDMFVENSALQKENEELRARLKRSAEEQSLAAAELAEKNLRNAELRAEVDGLKSGGSQTGNGAGDAGSNGILSPVDPALLFRS